MSGWWWVVLAVVVVGLVSVPLLTGFIGLLAGVAHTFRQRRRGQ